MKDREIDWRINSDNRMREQTIWAVVSAIRGRKAKVLKKSPDVLWFRVNGVKYLIRVRGRDEFEIIIDMFGGDKTKFIRYEFPRNLSCLIEEYWTHVVIC